jgi:hypothetical protein
MKLGSDESISRGIVGVAKAFVRLFRAITSVNTVMLTVQLSRKEENRFSWSCLIVTLFA